MKTLLALVLSVFALTALGQTNPPAGGSTGTVVPGGDGVSLLLILIPLVVPIVVAIGKFFIPKLPGWTLPIIAPALGALIDYLTTRATGAIASPLLAAVLGSAGVGLRELVDQLKQKINPPSQTPPKP